MKVVRREVEFIVFVIAILVVATITILLIVTTATRQSEWTRDCRAAGGTPVADTCFAPGIVIEPN